MSKINNKDFIILNKYKAFLFSLDNLLENIPRRDYYFKDKIRNIAYEILNYILIINNSDDLLLIKIYFSLLKANISNLDFMLERLFIKKYIGETALCKTTNKLVEINKIVNSWVNNIINVKC